MIAPAELHALDLEAGFLALVARAEALLGRASLWSLHLQAEVSDFVRFNHGAIRQPGSATQRALTLKRMHGRRQASQTFAATGHVEDDLASIVQAAAMLDALLPGLPDDPYLVLNDTGESTRRVESAEGRDTPDLVREIVAQAWGLDLVGLLTRGRVAFGYANNFGVRHWHALDSFEFDFSLQHRGDKAVKTRYLGRHWDTAAFDAKLQRARQALALLDRPARKLAPGAYRTYLAPAALAEVVDLLAWGGFSAKEQATKRSPLQRLVEGAAAFDRRFSVYDAQRDGLAPAFNADGFVRTPRLALIEHGRHAGAIVSPRTGAEYGLAHTGGDADEERPHALEVAAGDLAQDDVPRAIGDGLYVNNLWYLNFSDRANARMTGMTRFATFVVENGTLVAPCEVMRFDDSVYRMLGAGLVDLTREREPLSGGGGWQFRSVDTAWMPGALIDDFALTL